MNPPKHSHDVHESWVKRIQDDGHDLTEWETNFIEDLAHRFSSGKKLISDRQEEVLERIYSEKTPIS